MWELKLTTSELSTVLHALANSAVPLYARGVIDTIIEQEPVVAETANKLWEDYHGA